MAIGPGKYDKDLLHVMQQHSALAGMLVLIGGKRGHGISCKVAADPDNPLQDVIDMHKVFISILRRTADQIEADLPELTNELLRSKG